MHPPFGCKLVGLDLTNGDKSLKGAVAAEVPSVAKKSTLSFTTLMRASISLSNSALAHANSRALKMINLNRIMFDKNLLLNWLSIWQNTTFYSLGKRDYA